MTRILFTLILASLGGQVCAESIVAARTIRSQSVITGADIAIAEGSFPGAITQAALVIGLEARVNLFAGRPIMPEHVGPAALIERNQIVPLVFERGGLRITSEARAMSRAGLGDMIRVMNLESRTTVSGIVMADGSVNVGRPSK